MVLALLDEPRPMGELAQHMHCDNSNMTGIVDRLAERGLVERRPAEGDRRVKLVALTDARARRCRPSSPGGGRSRPTRSPRLDTEDLQRLREIFRGALDE